MPYVCPLARPDSSLPWSPRPLIRGRGWRVSAPGEDALRERVLRRFDRSPQFLGPERHIEMTNAERLQCIEHRVHDTWRGTNGARLANSLSPHRIEWRRCDRARQLVVRQHLGLRHRVIHQSSSEQLAVFVVNDFLVERLRDPLSDAAVYLPLDQQRAYHASAIVDRNVADEFDHAGFRVGFYHRHVCTEGISASGGFEETGRVQSWFEAGNCLLVVVGGIDYALERNRPA